MPFVLCLLVVGASVWVNIGLRIRFSHNDRLADRPAFALMAYDLLQLTCLLYLTAVWKIRSRCCFSHRS